LIEIYTDGACEGNQYSANLGGWAAIIVQNGKNIAEISGFEPNTTNNRMELRAILEGLGYLSTRKLLMPHECLIYSDSAYIVNCFHQQWYAKWRKNGWRTSKGTEVLNRDQWECLIDLVEQYTIRFEKVKGHVGIPLNERADRLAKRAIELHK